MQHSIVHRYYPLVELAVSISCHPLSLSHTHGGTLRFAVGLVRSVCVCVCVCVCVWSAHKGKFAILTQCVTLRCGCDCAGHKTIIPQYNTA